MSKSETEYKINIINNAMIEKTNKIENTIDIVCKYIAVDYIEDLYVPNLKTFRNMVKLVLIENNKFPKSQVIAMAKEKWFTEILKSWLYYIKDEVEEYELERGW